MADTDSPSNIDMVSGDILEDDAEAVVCTVNLQGTMGKGLALACAKRWPGLEADYASACLDGTLRIGSVFPWPTGQLLSPLWVVCVPTKRHWRNPSRLDDVKHGCDALAGWIRAVRPGSVAVPPLGCGLGGLDWADVWPVIRESVSGLDCNVRVYRP